MPNCLTKYASPQEAVIAKRLVAKALAAGYELAVHDGEEMALPRTRNKQAVLDALATTDMDSLIVYASGQPKRVGSIR